LTKIKVIWIISVWPGFLKNLGHRSDRVQPTQHRQSFAWVQLSSPRPSPSYVALNQLSSTGPVPSGLGPGALARGPLEAMRAPTLSAPDATATVLDIIPGVIDLHPEADTAGVIFCAIPIRDWDPGSDPTDLGMAGRPPDSTALDDPPPMPNDGPATTEAGGPPATLKGEDDGRASLPDPPSLVGRGQGVEAPRAPPHGPAVPYFPPPPCPPARAFHCRVEGLQPARRNFQKELGGGGGMVGARAGPGRDSWWARVHLHVSTRGQPHGPPPTPFPGGVVAYLRETSGWGLFLDRHRHRGAGE